MRLPPHCPVLARPGAAGAIDIQVGLAAPVVIPALSLAEREFVASLEGGRRVPPAQARRFARVVSILTLAGAWHVGEAPAPAQSVAVHGCGTLGMAIAAALRAGEFDVALHDGAPLAVEPVGTFSPSASGTCAAAAAQTLGDQAITVRIGGGGEALVVIVCTGAPDPALVSDCVLSGVPHVVVACDGVGVWVSHVIVPGLTPCARCRDIALTHLDSAWPSLALQLAGSGLPARRPVAPRLALVVVAARVSVRVAGWLERADPGTGEHIAANGELSLEPVRAEPSCGCGAAGPVGDDATASRAAWVAHRDGDAKRSQCLPTISKMSAP